MLMARWLKFVALAALLCVPMHFAVGKAVESDAALRCPSSTQLRVMIKKFAHQLFVQKDPETAYSTFASPDMVQHNVPFGRDLASTIAQWRTMTDRPASRFDILQIKLSDDVMVISFVGHLGPGRKAGVTQHDRVRCGQIVEEWAEFKILENRPADTHK